MNPPATHLRVLAGQVDRRVTTYSDLVPRAGRRAAGAGLSGADLLAGRAGDARVLANFFAGNVNNRGGVRVGVKDLDEDARADLVVGNRAGAGSRVTGYLGRNLTPTGTPPEEFGFDAYPGLMDGVFVG